MTGRNSEEAGAAGGAGQAAAGIDARQLRNALGRFATGVTVITTCSAVGRAEGLTANSFSSLSLDPPLVVWSLRRTSAALASYSEAGRFAVSVLAADQEAIARQFATPAIDKFAGIAVEAGAGGCPLIAGALAHFECRTVQALDGGDHVLFIGRVERCDCRDGEPLLFSAGRFAKIARETSAAASPVVRSPVPHPQGSESDEAWFLHDAHPSGWA